MLLLALLIAASAGAHAQEFNITYFSVPAVVGYEEEFAELECHYQAKGFTTFGFWRNSREFFRFQPIASPSIRVFELYGAESVEMIYCGLEACKIRIGGMSTNASGIYKCDLIKDVPPLLAVQEAAVMVILRNEPKQPVVEGLVEEYDNGDTLRAHCRAEPGSTLRWFINGHEHIEFRNLTTIEKQVYPGLRRGLPRTLSVQCAVYTYGKHYFSEARTSRWCADYSYKLEEEPAVVTAPTTQIAVVKAPPKGTVDVKPSQTDVIVVRVPRTKITEIITIKEVKVIILCNKGTPVITGFLGLLSTLLNLFAKLVHV